MPELPEVETVRADLAERLVGRRFDRIVVPGATSVVGMTAASFVRRLRGRRVLGARRRAKWLLFPLDDGHTLAVHLRMTGQLIHVAAEQVVALPNPWTRASFACDDGSTLHFNDIRRFGTLEILVESELNRRLERYGMEPLTESWRAADFSALFAGCRTSVKALLLDQSRIAGLGNIYADEACFAAGLRPRRCAGRTTLKERHKLFQAVDRIIRRAVAARGTSFSDYRDASGREGGFGPGLKVYGRGGEPCRCCATLVRRVVHGGRGTHFCPSCQH